ncbi:CBS domain-containing protein [Candidatus Pacearchaeota archaeon]|nr:CBS domain-containing protein [Candidatus Pacearchaeota archaeon]
MESTLQDKPSIRSALEEKNKKKLDVSALILAGGFGTRLRSVVNDVPKPMALIAGKPFLEHQIRYLKEQGITNIVIAVHYESDKIKSYFGDGRLWYVDITYSDEDIPLGTAGAIANAKKYFDDTFIVLNGDTYSPLDIEKMLEFHKAKRSNFTMALHKSEDVSEYGKVLLEGNKITGLMEKEHIGNGFINRGIYIFEPRIFNYIEEGKNVSLEKEIFPLIIKENSLFGYFDESYFIDIGRPETYYKFKQDMIKSIFVKKDLSIKDALYKIGETGINLILVVDEEGKLKGVFNERFGRDHFLRGGSVNDPVEKAMIIDPVIGRTDDEKLKIDELLMSGINHLPIVDLNGVVRDVEFRKEKITNSTSTPIVRGRAPLRISFSGGGTDLPSFFEKHGGVVISATIDKYCYATLVKRADSKIIIDSDMTEENDVFVDSIKDLKYDGNFDLIKAIIKVIKPDFGFEIYLHNDVPPGRGLGSSASLSVLLISMFAQMQDLKFDDYKIAELAYKAEREELKIKGGWQDQYAAITGGFNFMEFNGDKTIIYPLRLKEHITYELNERMMLCYVGNDHSSAELHESQQQSIQQNETEIVNCLNETKKFAVEIKDYILTNNLDAIGSILHKSWMNKKKLSNKMANPRIDKLYETGLKNGALGGRLLGAGGGGYLLFFYSPRKRNQLRRALEKDGGKILDFNFESGGTVVWKVKSKF